jgi:hypothetical protein
MLSHDKILSKEKQSGRMSRVRQNSANIRFVQDSVKGISTKSLNQIHCKPSRDTKVKPNGSKSWACGKGFIVKKRPKMRCACTVAEQSVGTIQAQTKSFITKARKSIKEEEIPYETR